MDKLKSLSGSSSKEDIKAQYQITFKKIDGLPKSWTNPLHLSWKRGSKKENSGEVISIPRDGIANLEHPITLSSTITKTGKGAYLPKTISLTLKEEIKALGPGKKPISLGSCEINLAQYIESRTEKSNLFQIKDKSKPICNLYVTIQSNWLKINGKSLVKVEGGQNQKEVLKELGKQQITQEGSDYYLQTEQDMSEPDQTDVGGENHDSDDEDDVSFEDDSLHSGSSITTTGTTGTTGTLKRHSSNLSSTSSNTGSNIENTSNINLNDLFKPPTNTATTTTTTSTAKTETPVKESSSINANTMESKFKKYKRKLKSYKQELEKSKIEKEEVKKMYDEMEKIKERTKTVGDGVLHDYILQIDQLTKENQELKSEVHKEKHQSSRDSSEIINLQNQVISLGQQLDNINQENITLNENIRVLEENNTKTTANSNTANEIIQSDLQQELIQSQTTIDNLNLELNQIKNQLTVAQDENRNQFIQLEQERLKSNSNESNANRVIQENNNLKQQINHSEKTIHLQIDEFEKEKLLLTNEINNLKNAVTEKFDISAHQEELENLRITIKQKVEIIEDNEELNQTNTLEIEKLKELIDTLESEIKNLKDLNITKDQEIESLAIASANNSGSSNDEEILNLKDQIEMKDQEIQNLKSKDIEIQDLKVNLKDKQDEIDLINSKRLESDDSLEELKLKLSELQEKLSEKQDLINQLESKSSNDDESSSSMYKEEIRSMQTLIDNREKEIQVLKSNLELQEKEIDLLKSTNSISIEDFKDEKDEEILELKMKFENEKIDFQNELQRLSNIAEENNKLKLQITEYQSDSNYKQNLVNEYQAMLDKLQIDLDESISKNQDLILKLQQQKSTAHDNENNDGEKDSDNDSEKDNEKDEKIQELKDKVKKLKSKLEDKDDEWIENKIKFEEQIHELQSDNHKLKSDNDELNLNLQDLKSNISIVPVVLDNEKEINEIKSRLEKEIIRSRSLEQELQDQKELFLLAQTPQSNQSPILSPSSSSPKLSNGYSSGNEDIKKELEENKSIESSIYWSEIDYDRNSVPYCGSSVWQLIDSLSGGISKVDNQRLLGKVIVSLEKSFLRSGSDCKFICYWMSTVSYLLHKIHQVGITQSNADPFVSGIEISMSSFCPVSSDMGGTFIRDLQSLLLNIYSKLLSIIEIKIEKVLISTVFLPDSLIMKSSPMVSNTMSPMSKFQGSNSSGSSANGTPNKSSTSKSIHNLLSILDGIIQFLKESKISDVISNQLLNQIFFFMNSQITNYLLTNPKVCTSTQGLEVKLGVSRLKEWCSQTNFKSASQQLDSSHEASNLLVIDKNVFVDVDAIKSIFSKLNLNQIRTLLESFSPDDLSPEPLPSSLKKAMDNNWRQPFDISSLPLQIDSSKKLKLN